MALLDRARHRRDRRRHLRRPGRAGPAHRGGDAAAAGCARAVTRAPWPGCCAGWPWPGRPAPPTADERAGLLAELEKVTGWLAARAADAPDNFLHLLRLLEAERAWTAGDFRAAALAFDAARREAAARSRPWHRALITERAARFYLGHGLDQAGYDLLAQARQQYLAWGATAKAAQLDWAYPVLRPPARRGRRGWRRAARRSSRPRRRGDGRDDRPARHRVRLAGAELTDQHRPAARPGGRGARRDDRRHRRAPGAMGCRPAGLAAARARRRRHRPGRRPRPRGRGAGIGAVVRAADR